MTSPIDPREMQGPDGPSLSERWRAAEQRYDERLKDLGIEKNVPLAEDDPKLEGFEQTWKCLQKDLDEIRALLPARPRTPPGWEGPAPDAKIETIDDLIRFVEAELRQVHTLGRSHHLGWTFVDMSAESLLNAHRWLLDAGVRRRPFPQRPTNADDAERELANLLIWLDEYRDETTRPDQVRTEQEPTGTVQKKAMKWQEARERLELLQRQGERYTSRAELAHRIGCSSSTIQKAFVESNELRTWEQAKSVKTPPVTSGLSDTMADDLAQSRESVPGTLPTADEADVILKRLLGEAPAERRAALQSAIEKMPLDDRLQLAATYENADDLTDHIRGRRP